MREEARQMLDTALTQWEERRQPRVERSPRDNRPSELQTLRARIGQLQARVTRLENEVDLAYQAADYWYDNTKELVKYQSANSRQSSLPGSTGNDQCSCSRETSLSNTMTASSGEALSSKTA